MVKDFDQWMQMMLKRVSIAVFDPYLVALVTVGPTGDDIYEVHVDCQRQVDHEVLIIALLNIRKVVFEQWGAREVFAGVISRNSGIIRVAQICGFTPDGITEQAGRLKFIRLRMTNEQYANEYQHRHDYKPISADAGGVIPGYRSTQAAAVSS